MRYEFQVMAEQDRIIASGVEEREPHARRAHLAECGRPHVLRCRRVGAEAHSAELWVRYPIPAAREGQR